MAGQADGYIIIDTEIDTNGANSTGICGYMRRCN